LQEVEYLFVKSAVHKTMIKLEKKNTNFSKFNSYIFIIIFSPVNLQSSQEITFLKPHCWSTRSASLFFKPRFILFTYTLQAKPFILSVISKPMQSSNLIPVVMGFVVNDVAEIVSLRVLRLNPASTIPPIA
jgi:hypothetical protein